MERNGIELATTSLRWNNGVLEQMWRVMRYNEEAEIEERRTEWRPVKSIGDAWDAATEPGK